MLRHKGNVFVLNTKTFLRKYYAIIQKGWLQMDFLSVVPQKTKEARSSTLMFAFGFSLLIYL